MEILIRDTPEEGAHVASRLVRKVLSTRSNPVLGLATGGTPLRLYREMIRMYQAGELSFQDCTSFNLDEYVGLGAADRRSFAAYMARHLGKPLQLSPQQLHLPDGEAINPEQQAGSYAAQLQSFGGVGVASGLFIVISVLAAVCALRRCSKKKKEEIIKVDDNGVYGVYQLGEDYERRYSTNEVVDNNLYYEQ